MENRLHSTLDWEDRSYRIHQEAEGPQSLPSPREIQEMCREIREGWSEAEHRRRAGYSTRPLQLATHPCRISLPDWS